MRNSNKIAVEDFLKLSGEVVDAECYGCGSIETVVVQLDGKSWRGRVWRLTDGSTTGLFGGSEIKLFEVKPVERMVKFWEVVEE
jgi:hypothetical protein